MCQMNSQSAVMRSNNSFFWRETVTTDVIRSQSVYGYNDVVPSTDYRHLTKYFTINKNLKHANTCMIKF